MTVIIDYGVGNLFSLTASFKKIGVEAVVTNDIGIISNADRIILPGVGAFGDAAKKLEESGLDKFVISEAKKGKPLLGICLGMQLLFEESEEFGTHKGLGLLKGNVIPMKGIISEDLKIPQMGWNNLIFKRNCQLFKYIKNNDYVYFVHSFFASECDESLVATTNYGKELTAAVAKDNVYGCQFHPEKSGDIGLNILKAFCEI